MNREEGLRTALDYAKELALHTARKWWPENGAFKPLDDLVGVLSQIDNMLTGLVRPSPPDPMLEGAVERLTRAARGQQYGPCFVDPFDLTTILNAVKGEKG